MADRTIKFIRLKQILASFGVQWNPKKGKGSHGSFYQQRDGGTLTYPLPKLKDVYIPYVRACRKKFKLTAEDGVSDEAFYDA